MSDMEIQLDPPNGITGFPLGMSAEAVKAAVGALGEIKVKDEDTHDDYHPMQVLALHPQFEINFVMEGAKTLESAEVWIPRPGSEEITVKFRELDVFRTPALQLIQQIEELGFTTLHDSPSYWFVPRLSLGFTRTAGHDVPLDTDGEPLYFQAVLVGPTDYYDYKLEK